MYCRHTIIIKEVVQKFRYSLHDVFRSSCFTSIYRLTWRDNENCDRNGMIICISILPDNLGTKYHCRCLQLPLQVYNNTKITNIKFKAFSIEKMALYSFWVIRLHIFIYYIWHIFNLQKSVRM